MDNPEFMPPGLGSNIGNEAAAKKKMSLFTKKKEDNSNVSEVLEQTISLSRRIKLIEERFTDIGRRIELTASNLLNERQRATKEFRTFDSELIEIKRDINEINIKLDLIITELKGCASKDELNALKKYVDMWEPISFIRREEAERIIDERLEETKR